MAKQGRLPKNIRNPLVFTWVIQNKKRYCSVLFHHRIGTFAADLKKAVTNPLNTSDLRPFLAAFLAFFLAFGASFGQHDDHDHGDQAHHGEATGNDCGIVHHDVPEEYNPGEVAFHHISDQNIYTIGPWAMSLPCFLYAPAHGWSVFSSGEFEAHGHHGDGEKAIDRYVMHNGVVMRVRDDAFPMGEIAVNGFTHKEVETQEGEEVTEYYVCHAGELYELDQESALDGGLFNRNITSFYDFSITKNVVAMILVAILLGWMFISIARAYSRRDGRAPKGVQSFIEPIYIFIRDDVAKAMIGEDKYEKYVPFIMSLFFFILALNLIGQVPFLGNPNVTGSLAFTMVLAVFTFLVTNLNGNAHYWQHVFWMPGIPWPVKLVMTPVEILGLFLKPITLMVRLFANITAGHIVILSFVGLTFIFGQMGQNAAGGFFGGVVGVLLGIFMSAIELLVAFLQAFIFAILSASYIGAAVVDDHH